MRIRTIGLRTLTAARGSFRGSDRCRIPGMHVSGLVFTWPLIAASERSCKNYRSFPYPPRTRWQVAAAPREPKSQLLLLAERQGLTDTDIIIKHGAHYSVGAWTCLSSRQTPRGEEEPHRILRPIASLNFSDCLLPNILPAAAQWRRLLVRGCYDNDMKVGATSFMSPGRTPLCVTCSKCETIWGRNVKAFTHIESLHSS